MKKGGGGLDEETEELKAARLLEWIEAEHKVPSTGDAAGIVRQGGSVDTGADIWDARVAEPRPLGMSE